MLAAFSLLGSFALGCVTSDGASSGALPSSGASSGPSEQVAQIRSPLVTTQDATIGTILAQQAAAASVMPVGGAAAVIVNGHVYYNVWGNRYVGTNTPVQPGDRFAMGSITKVMTGEWIARMVDAGYITWNTRMVDSLPGLFTGAEIDNPHQFATVAQMMSHTAGLAYQPTDHNPGYYYPNLPLEDRRLAYDADAIGDPLLYPIGTVAVYSGGAVIAASMIEQTIGLQYEQCLASGLFFPLGMGDASFAALSSTFAINGIWNHSGTAPLVPEDPRSGITQRSPVGGVGSSVLDMAKFLSYAMTSHPNMRATVGRSNYTSLGWGAAMTDPANGIEMSHNGSDASSYYASAWMWPDRGVALIVATNSNNAEYVKKTYEALKATVSTWGPPPVAFPHASAPTYKLPAAQVTATSTKGPFAAVNAFDGSYGSHWEGNPGISTPISLTATLNGPTTVSGAVINEGGVNPEPTQPLAKYGSGTAYRIRGYKIWLWDSTIASWVLAISGNYIGTNKVISFRRSYSQITKVRLDITAPDGPLINEFHLLP